MRPAQRERLVLACAASVLAIAVLTSCRTLDDDARDTKLTAVVLGAESPEEPRWRKALEAALEKPVSFDFVGVPVDDGFAFLRNATKTNIIIEKAAKWHGNLDVTLKLDKVPLREALTRICKRLDLAYMIENGAIFITTRERAFKLEEIPFVYRSGRIVLAHGANAKGTPEDLLEEYISFRFFTRPLRNVAALLTDLKKVDIIVDPRAGDPPVTAGADAVKLKEALRRICKSTGTDYLIRGKTIIISTKRLIGARQAAEQALHDPKADQRIAAALGQPVSFDFIATPLDDVIAFLRNLMRINIIVDKRAISEAGDRNLDVTLRLDKVKLRDALDWILRLVDLQYTVRCGAIFVSTKEGIRARDLAITMVHHAKPWRRFEAKMMEPISFDFIATPLDDVVAFLRNLKMVSIRVDKKAVADRLGLDLTLRVKGMKFSQALAWICYRLRLAYTVTDKGILISTPDELLKRTETVK